jgi:hypothetical protein
MNYSHSLDSIFDDLPEPVHTLTKAEIQRQKKHESHRRSYKKNREKRLQYAKEYQKQNKELTSQKSKARYKKNRETVLEYQKEYQAKPENKIKRKAYIEEYNITHAHVKQQYYANIKDTPEHKKLRAERGQTLDYKFTAYKTAAKRRNFEFTLSKEQFSLFWQQPCFYCGSEILTIGIDRVDNELGYISENCVSCCPDCNMLKRGYSLEFVKQHISTIQNYDGIVTNATSQTSTIYPTYRSDALRRNLEFTITREEFNEVRSKSCSYCGSTERIGIDRIDNGIGYTKDNITSCCKECNLMKWKHDKTYFLQHINKIYNHLQL